MKQIDLNIFDKKIRDSNFTFQIFNPICELKKRIIYPRMLYNRLINWHTKKDWELNNFFFWKKDKMRGSFKYNKI